MQAHGGRSQQRQAVVKVRRYGLWMIAGPLSFQDSRIWKEDRMSYALPTRFQRLVGVRYRRDGGRQYPDSSGFYGELRQARTITPWRLLQGYFNSRPPSRQALRLRPGYLKSIRNATGKVLLWAPHLRLRAATPGLRLVGTLRVREVPDGD